MKQLDLIKKEKYKSRKTVRALSLREMNHVILKARLPILRKNHALVKNLFRETQLRFGIRIKSMAIMEDHLHFAMKVPSRKAFADAMRFFAGHLALRIGKGKLWKQRVWSRIVRMGRDLKSVLDYIRRNPIKAGVLNAKVDLYHLLDGMLLAPS